MEIVAVMPGPVRSAFRWLCQPRLAWLRIPLAFLLIAGGFLGFLQILGFWMMPVGILLLAEDLPFLRRPTMRALRSVQEWWDRRRR